MDVPKNIEEKTRERLKELGFDLVKIWYQEGIKAWEATAVAYGYPYENQNLMIGLSDARTAKIAGDNLIRAAKRVNRKRKWRARISLWRSGLRF